MAKKSQNHPSMRNVPAAPADVRTSRIRAVLVALVKSGGTDVDRAEKALEKLAPSRLEGCVVRPKGAGTVR